MATPIRILAAASVLALVVCAAAAAVAAQGPPRGTPRTPVPFDRVEMTGDFWAQRYDTQARVLVPFAFEKTRPAVEYLEAAAAHLAGETPAELPPPHRYKCSDLYKVLEGAAYLFSIERDPELEASMDRIAATIAAAQRDDGYLYCAHVLGHGSARHMMGDGPYEYVVHSHELYNLGHLYEAAVAYFRATGKRTLLDVAISSARHVREVFFEGAPGYAGGKPVRQAPGHQGIELALVRLAAVTGEQEFADTAKKLLDVRGVTYMPEGTGVMSPTYAQQHAPVATQRAVVGHAVRAMYMYSGMADVDAFRGADEYVEALDAIWRDIVDKKMHITGGLGAMHGIEGFGPAYELPNAEAYNETCAAVGNVLFNQRMYRLHGDARFLDVAEVALFNNVLAGVALSGDAFFYVNPLEADGERAFNHGRRGRSPWFSTACCPTNIARLLPQVAGMVYSVERGREGRDALAVTMYAASRTVVGLGRGADGAPVDVAVEQETRYPFDGRVALRLAPEAPVRFALRLRIPTWARGERFVPGALYCYAEPVEAPVRITVAGQPVEAPVERGFAVVEREWRAGDEVVLELPMPVQVSVCDERVEANRGRVALTRGPLVLCAEEVDHGVAAQRLFVGDDVAARARDARVEERALVADRGSAPHRHRTVFVSLAGFAVPRPGGEVEDRRLTLLPYYAWSNRGVGSMVTWLPTAADLLPEPGDGLAGPRFVGVRASHTWQGDRVEAVADGRIPTSSADTSIPRWTSWPQRGEPQWVEMEFDTTRGLASVAAYFYDDGGGVQLPVSWRLEVRRDGVWRPFELYVTDSYETGADRFNVVHPAGDCPADAVRVRLEARDRAAVGLLELQVRFSDGD